MHMGMKGNETDMTRFENVEDFDKAFIEEMIPRHQIAFMMANMLRNGTQREEMKTLAEDIITAQTDEIDQMRSWYQGWYKKVEQSSSFVFQYCTRFPRIISQKKRIIFQRMKVPW